MVVIFASSSDKTGLKNWGKRERKRKIKRDEEIEIKRKISGVKERE